MFVHLLAMDEFVTGARTSLFGASTSKHMAPKNAWSEQIINMTQV